MKKKEEESGIDLNCMNGLFVNKWRRSAGRMSGSAPPLSLKCRHLCHVVITASFDEHR